MCVWCVVVMCVCGGGGSETEGFQLLTHNYVTEEDFSHLLYEADRDNHAGIMKLCQTTV